MSIWTDEEGRRHVGIMVGGKRVHRILPKGASAGDAKRLEAELRAAMAQRRPSIPGDPPLTAIMQGYVEHAQTLRSPDTAVFHAARVGPWAARFRASQADECAALMVKDMRAVITHKNGTVGPAYAWATINRSLGTLKKALQLAWKAKTIPENYGLRISRVAEHNAREIFLSIDQVRRIAEHCSAPAKAAIWFALLTGARRGEIVKIQRHHISLDSIEIPSSHTKMQRPRVVPIIPALRPWLEHFPLQMTLYGVQSAFRRARKSAGMEHVHFHDLRHSCASILISLDVDLFTVSKILGHTSINTTQRYAHLQIQRQRDALSKLGDLVLPEGVIKKAAKL